MGSFYLLFIIRSAAQIIPYLQSPYILVYQIGSGSVQSRQDGIISIFDIERLVLTGQIVERQKDKKIQKGGNMLPKGKLFHQAWQL